jgi:hypothetical protein
MVGNPGAPARVVLTSMNLLLAVLALAPQDSWWDPAWGQRRRLLVQNGTERPLPAGAAVEVDVDPAFLELAGRAKADLSDLALVHAGRRRPHVLLPGRMPGRRTLVFASAAEIAPGKVDDRYAVYYGNPSGGPPEGKVFDVFEDFSDATRFRTLFQADDGLACSVREGALEIRDVPEERTRLAPARLAWTPRPAAPAFALEFDLEADLSGGPLAAAGIEIELRQPEAADPAAARRIAELVEALGEADFELRERASRALAALGPAAVPALLEAARSSDPEVRWRAEQAVREIRKASPPSVIRAGLAAADAKNRFALVSEIGGAATRQLVGLGEKTALSVKILIERDEDGAVAVSWNGGRGQKGVLAGELARISFVFHRTASGRPAPLRIDNVVLRRPVAEDERPATRLEPEESRAK